LIVIVVLTESDVFEKNINALLFSTVKGNDKLKAEFESSSYKTFADLYTSSKDIL
jgi:hypothetical protein